MYVQSAHTWWQLHHGRARVGVVPLERVARLLDADAVTYLSATCELLVRAGNSDLGALGKSKAPWAD